MSTLMVPISPDEWLLQNHRVHYQAASLKRVAIKNKTAWLAKTNLEPAKGPVAIYARAYIRTGPLCDADAIAPMVKAAIDGLVIAGIIPDDTGEHVPLVGYGRPARDRTLKPKMHALQLVLTDQYIPF
ncbi:hypothetical protein FYJ24_07010 [Actinomycetaceae bacterium WB03_NA08]|uniref:Uncharacterized protein n=1 Tax=Scrofimicrobium canadense TaxID=2652290 RepID=A0A6N7VRW3_9ACTO|nr:hypothetical protein [Scrofimicrobium canadense]MSS84517.1 hypothetical protein [Scrofimicrobium canadense]